MVGLGSVKRDSEVLAEQLASEWFKEGCPNHGMLNIKTR
jgi:hypothetical protein